MTRNVKYVLPPAGEFWSHTWAVSGDLIISVIQEGEAPQSVWDRWAKDAGSHRVKMLLGCSIGTISVNSTQRRQAAAALDKKRLAVVMNSAVARGIATAVGWLGLDIKGYSWSDFDKAIARLNCETLTRDEIIEITTELLARSQAPSLAILKAE